MPPEEAIDATCKEQSVPPPPPQASDVTQDVSSSGISSKANDGPPETGWLRSSDLFRARKLSKADRHTFLRELSEVSVLF